MKKLIILSLVILAAQVSNAQKQEVASQHTFKKFKTDISVGYAIPKGSGTKGGVIFVIEPKYAIIDKLSVGLRMEGAALANVNIAGNKGTVRMLASGLLTGDYYFNNNKFRPFGGAGAGVYRMASIDIKDSGAGASIPQSSSFGFMARAGFELGHLRMGLEYNFLKAQAGYFGIKLGVCIGGGRK